MVLREKWPVIGRHEQAAVRLRGRSTEPFGLIDFDLLS